MLQYIYTLFLIRLHSSPKKTQEKIGILDKDIC